MARHDFDRLSISQISKASRTSVGAFYVRFSDKETFLNFVITNTFDHAKTIFQEQTDVCNMPDLANVLVRQFSDPEFSGIVRAAVKLGFLNDRHRAPFDEFRTFVSQHLSELLLADVRNGERRQRIAAIDSALAILTHSALLPDPRIDLAEVEIQQIIIGLLSGKSGNTKPPLPKKPGPVKSRNKPPKTSHDPESLRKPNADTMKPKGSARGPRKI